MHTYPAMYFIAHKWYVSDKNKWLLTNLPLLVLFASSSHDRDWRRTIRRERVYGLEFNPGKVSAAKVVSAYIGNGGRGCDWP